MRPVASAPAGVACAVALAMVSLGGCGSSSSSSTSGIATKTPEQILAAARAAVHGAATVHVSGSVLRGGTPLSLDMELVAGKGGQGHIAQGGLDLQLIEVGHFAYLKGSPAFFRHLGGEALVGVLRGKWLKARMTGSFSSLASLTNLGELVDTALTSHGKLESNGTSTVDGQKVVAISDPARGGTLYVASVGSPYPIAILEDGGRAGTIVFDRWNKPVTLIAPGSAINVNQLETHP